MGRPDLWWWDDFVVLVSGLPATSNTTLLLAGSVDDAGDALPDIGDPDRVDVDAVWAHIDRARGVTPKRTSDWSTVRALDGRARVPMVDGHIVTGTVDW